MKAEMTKKEMFRKLIAEQSRNETPAKAVERPVVLIKRECSHRECATLPKCGKTQSYGGIDY